VAWAQVKGYPTWPCIEWRWTEKTVGVGGFSVATKSNRYCQFFGDDESISWCPPGNVVAFHEQSATIAKRHAAAAKNAKLKTAIELATAEADACQAVRAAEAEKQRKVLATQARLPAEWVGLTVRHFRPEINYPQGAWCRACIVKYAPKQRKHLLAYDEGREGLLPAWVALDNKSTHVEEVAKGDGADGGGSSGGGGDGSGGQMSFLASLPTARQAKLSKEAEAAAQGSAGKAACGGCRRHYTGVEPLVCRGCASVCHHCCMSPPLEKRPTVAEASRWVCSDCVACVGCGAERRAKPDVQPTKVPSGTHELCKQCTPKFSSRKHCPVCLVLWEAPKANGGSASEQPGGGGEDAAALEGHAPAADGLGAAPAVAEAASAIACDQCSFWVHPHCDGLSEETYLRIARDEEPSLRDGFLCPICRPPLVGAVLTKLEALDQLMLFAEPVVSAAALPTALRSAPPPARRSFSRLPCALLRRKLRRPPTATWCRRRWTSARCANAATPASTSPSRCFATTRSLCATTRCSSTRLGTGARFSGLVACCRSISR